MAAQVTRTAHETLALAGTGPSPRSRLGDAAMIQRLIESLQALAAPADVQLSRFPDFVVKGEELALDFDDAFMLVRDCPQLLLTSAQLDALVEIDRALAAISGARHAELWTEAALRESARWDAVRTLARAALITLNTPVQDPDPPRTVYVRGDEPGA